LFAALLGMMTVPASAASVEDFYKGKTIDLIVGGPAGGSYSIYAQVIAQHMSRHIPGNPTIVSRSMTGAGGLTAAGFIFNVARQDGTVFGTIPVSALIEPLFDDKQANFDASKFSWIGSASQTISYCGINPATKVTSFDQWLNSSAELRLAASGVGAISFQHPNVMKSVLGVPLKIINGYNGSGDFILSVERGETDGFCSMDASTIENLYKGLLNSGKMKLVVQMGPRKETTFGEIPSVFDYAKTEQQREILSVAFDQLALGRPFMAPPDMPDDRYQALHDAFARTLKDADFLADTVRMKLDINYLSGREAKEVLVKLSSYPESVLESAKRAFGK
jgi:tripartite-type tricarboxylate transporter receptor subunit TctC